MRCPLQGTTYAAALHMDLCYQLEGGGVQRLNRRLGMLPIMVKSDRCYLRHLTRSASLQCLFTWSACLQTSLQSSRCKVMMARPSIAAQTLMLIVCSVQLHRAAQSCTGISRSSGLVFDQIALLGWKVDASTLQAMLLMLRDCLAYI